MPVSPLRRRIRIVAAITAVVGLVVGFWRVATIKYLDPRARRVGPFLATPYLMLGELSPSDALTLLWHADDRDAPWSVEVQSPIDAPWRPVEVPRFRQIKLDDVEPSRIYQSVLGGLVAGTPFRYRVKLNASTVFEAQARAKGMPGKAQRFVAFGDCAADTTGQRKIAYQTYLTRPEYVMVTGDIVYMHGRVGQYRAEYFPIYAARRASPLEGAPLLGSTLFVAAPGNHDIRVNNFDDNADLMAYFYFWSQPLNGPTSKDGVRNIPPLAGNEARQKAFRDLAGSNYPRMANFSFDYGDVHWTVLDANHPYMHWSDPDLRAWVAADLEAAKAKPWRFVAFHHPAFSSSKAHFDEQQMRLLADVFERGGVSLVFSGHVHNYQRSYPLKFAATVPPDLQAPEPGTPVAGEFTIDRAYDGTSQTHPSGVIYLVTGAGGADLYDEDQTDNISTWQPFSCKFIADVYSFTLVDVTPETTVVRQIDADGKTLDSFTIAR